MVTITEFAPVSLTDQSGISTAGLLHGKPPAEPGPIPWDCAPAVEDTMTTGYRERFLVWRWKDNWGRTCQFRLSDDQCVDIPGFGLIARVSIPQEKKPREPYTAVFTLRDLDEDELLDRRLFDREHYERYMPEIVLED